MGQVVFFQAISSKGFKRGSWAVKWPYEGQRFKLTLNILNWWWRAKKVLGGFKESFILNLIGGGQSFFLGGLFKKWEILIYIMYVLFLVNKVLFMQKLNKRKLWIK